MIRTGKPSGARRPPKVLEQSRLTAAGLTRAETICLGLHWYHGLSQREIGEIVHLSQQAVSHNIRKGLRQLKRSGVFSRRRRHLVKPLMLSTPPTLLDQLTPEEVKVGW